MPSDFQFIGQGRITGGSDNTWLIGEVPIRVDGHTQLGSELRPGGFVTLSGRILQNKVWLADRIEAAAMGESFFTFSGPLEAMGVDTWLIGGNPLWVNRQTILAEDLALGELVLATFTVLPEGQWQALEIKAFDQFPADPTPVPTPTQMQTAAPDGSTVPVSPPGFDGDHGDKGKGKDKNKDGKGGENGKGRGRVKHGRD